MATKIGEDELAKTIGNWLRSERIRVSKQRGRDLTQREIAQELGLTDGTPAQWENGRAMPRADRLVRVALAFGFSLVALSALLGLETSGKQPGASK